jgi:hypothetical protein
MGRIFTYQEIETGQVPDSATFEIAKEAFMEATGECIDIDGSFIYGSVALGMANRRSDFDSFIALTEDCPRSYGAAKAVVQSVREEAGYNIPILPIVHPRASLEIGHHDLDRFFGQHLSSHQRIVEGNDPAEYITFSPLPAKDVLAGYLFQKKRRLANTFTSTDPLNVGEGGLQRMLELPQAIGRKTLQALVEVNVLGEAVERSADKAAVLDKSRSLFEHYGLASGFDILVEANKDYDELLDEAMEGSIYRETYEDMIQSLYSRLPDAVIWVEQLAKTVLPLFKS